MIRFLVDQHQIDSAAKLLTNLNPTIFGSDAKYVADIMIKDINQVRDLVDASGDDGTIVASFNAYVVIAIPAAQVFAETARLGYSHVISLTVNTTVIENTGVTTPTEPPAPPVTPNFARDDVKYIHLRRFDVVMLDDVVIQSTVCSKGGRTIAFVDNGDGTLTYAIAKCHTRDVYNKKVGNAVARARLDSPATSRRIFASINEFRNLVDEGEIVTG